MDGTQKLEETIKKLEAAYDKFVKEVETAKKEHREKISVILKQIEERKVKEMQEKIKSL